MTFVDTPGAETRNSYVRFWIIAVLFLISSINYASRATLGVAGKPLAAEFHLDPVQLGYLLSAFATAYAIGQIPGGALLDRYGSRRVYIWSISLWAIFTGLQAFVSWLSFVPALIRASLSAPAFPPMPASSPTGSPSRSAAPHRPSSMPRNTSRWSPSHP
jgi:ACS family glucarate transporter-like MFS transporter